MSKRKATSIKEIDGDASKIVVLAQAVCKYLDGCGQESSPVDDLFTHLGGKLKKSDFKKTLSSASVLPDARFLVEGNSVRILREEGSKGKGKKSRPMSGTTSSPTQKVGGAEEECTTDCAEESLPVGCVIKIFGTGVDPSYTAPWRVKQQKTWTGSGFCVRGKATGSAAYVITNAHCVENATLLQVQKQDEPKKFIARARVIAHDLDLAIVEVDNDAFWSGVQTVDLAPSDHLVDLYSEVSAIGFPTGGSTVCVTKGVISRFDAHLYAHPACCGVRSSSRNSPGNIFILQVDSAINPGNSGGPAVDEGGYVVGVASSGRGDAQNIGYVIPSSIVHLFLGEVRSTGTWGGVSELGLRCRDLESDAFRAFIGMRENETGILVDDVAPLGSLATHVQPGDVLTHVDSLRVSNEGKVPIALNGQNVYVDADALVTCKPKHAVTVLKLLRHSPAGAAAAAAAAATASTPQQPPSPPGLPSNSKARKAGNGAGSGKRRQQQVEGGPLAQQQGSARALVEVVLHVKLTPLPPLAPRFHGFDASPEYVMLGGLIFLRLSVPLIRQALDAYYAKESHFWIDNKLDNRFKKDEQHEVVVLASVLKHDINIGCKMRPRVLKDVNGEVILGLAHLARVAAALEASCPHPSPAYSGGGGGGGGGGGSRSASRAAASPEAAASASTRRSEDFIRITFKQDDNGAGDGSDDDEDDDEDDDGITPKHCLPSVVLERAKLCAANAEICKAHAISSTIAPSLLEDANSSRSSSSSSSKAKGCSGGEGGGRSPRSRR